MPKPNLQTVIVSKDVAKTRTKATKIARKHANRIYTSRETKNSWRFRQRPPKDFEQKSFRTFPVPGTKGVSLVYGTLKNPQKRGQLKKNFSPPEFGRGPPEGYVFTVVRVEDLNYPLTGEFATPKSAAMQAWKLSKHLGDIETGVWGHLPGDMLTGWSFMAGTVVYDGDLDTYRAFRDEVVANVERRPPTENPRRDGPTLAQLRRWERYLVRAGEATNLEDLSELAISAREWMPSPTMLANFEMAVAQRAGDFGMSCGDTPEMVTKCVDTLIENQGRTLFDDLPRENPKLKKVPKSPRVMPDPGPCAWLGGLLEWGWKKGSGEYLWEPDGAWAFLWSPHIKGVIAIPDPSTRKRLSNVSRAGGAAKLFERFTSEGASNTYEIEIPKVKLQKLGKAGHIVYRSDKWNPGQDIDYIHDFKEEVQLFVGPSLEEPEVFLCFGGRLTCTERGLVY